MYAFLFVTHEINDEIFNRYYKLQQETENIGQSFFLFHKKVDENDSNSDNSESILFSKIKPYIFNENSLDKLDYEPIEETIIPGSNHFAILQFFLDNPGFDNYWVIEYDVIYNGDWAEFFGSFNFLDADFISSHVERFPEKPLWYWWNTLHLDNTKLQKRQLIRSFNPIYRISKGALRFLDNLLKGRRNWGHHEVLIPTALKYWGFKILDFGGSGEFVLPQFDEKFYLMPSTESNGTMRDTPPISEMESLMKNKLLHPVKIKNISNQSNS